MQDWLVNMRVRQCSIPVKTAIRSAFAMPPAANNRRREALCFRVVPLAVRPLSVYTYFLSRDICVVSGKMSVKLGLSACEWALLHC